MENYWNILGLEEGASTNEIKKAYGRMIRKHSPDKDPETFKKIRQAYEALCNGTVQKEADLLKELPDEWKNRYYEVMKLRDDQNLSEAINLCQSVLTCYPSDIFESLLSRLYLDNDNSGKAVKLREKLCKSHSHRLDYHLDLVEAYMCRGWYNKAVSLCEKLLQKGFCSLKLFSMYVDLMEGTMSGDELATLAQDASKLLNELESPSDDDFEDMFNIIRHLPEVISVYSGSLRYHASHFLPFFQTQLCKEKKSCWMVLAGLVFYECLSSQLKDHPELREITDTYGCWIHEHSLSISGDVQLIILQADFNCFRSAIENDSHVSDIIKKEAHYYYSKFITEESRRICSQPDVSPEQAMIFDLLNNTDPEEVLSQEYDTFLYLLHYYDEIQPSLLYIKETYPNLAKGMAPYLDLLLEKNQYQLKKEYEQKYKKLMGLPSAGQLTLKDLDIISDGQESYRRDTPKIGRNDPCPCGSGKKYKKCCGINK